jgi:hypothetical protein
LGESGWPVNLVTYIIGGGFKVDTQINSTLMLLDPWLLEEVIFLTPAIR